MQRRDFLQRAGLVAIGAGLLPSLRGENAAPSAPLPFPTGPLGIVKARSDRLIRVSVCTRPFRAQGPRIEPERIGEKLVVHNYGHGGSGWSLSWGAGTLAVQHATASGERDYAVIGAGAIGLTTALLLQRAGKRVTIYAKERPPETRSTFATGVWSPDSRVCAEEHATPAYGKIWEGMCRTSYRHFQTYLGTSGDPVEWRDRFTVSDVPYDEFRRRREAEEGPIKFGKFNELVKDLTPVPEDLAANQHPFGTPYVRRTTTMVYNLSSYQRILVSEFLAEGGRIERRELKSAADFAGIEEKTIINCTGYGARALLGDESIVPVRGQLALLIPQPEVTYGLTAEGVSMVSRRDGIVVQASKKTDFGNTETTPDRAETEEAVLALAKITTKMKPALV